MALIPPFYFDSVAALEEERPTEDPDQREYVAVATGTLLSFRTGHVNSEGEPLVAVFLATNRHVVEGQSHFYTRFNKGDRSERFRVDLVGPGGEALVTTNAEWDIAIVPIDLGAIQMAGAEFKAVNEDSTLDLDGLEREGVTGGDGIFVLGFPMGIAGTERRYAVARGGVVARLDREIVTETKGFLIDCSVFPGNSGGPVILRPEITSIQDTPSHDRALVIGLVTSYVPFMDVAVSQQTQRPRITFEENSGLARVVPLDPIIEMARARLARDMPPPPRGGPDEEGQTEEEIAPSDEEAPTS